MRVRRIRIVLMVSALIGFSCNTAPDDREIIGGTFIGYTFSEQPVVDATVDLKSNYRLIFKAYDLGESARFVVYVQRGETAGFHLGAIRLNILDPDGNAYTYYHSPEGEAIDRPIVWPKRTTGIHSVTVDAELYPAEGGLVRSTFEVPLIREPVSGYLVAGISLGVLALVAMAVALIRKRR